MFANWQNRSRKCLTEGMQILLPRETLRFDQAPNHHGGGRGAGDAGSRPFGPASEAEQQHTFGEAGATHGFDHMVDKAIVVA
jgi:hypothetical protein